MGRRQYLLFDFALGLHAVPRRRLRIPAESDEDKGMGIRPPTDHKGYARVSGENAPWVTLVSRRSRAIGRRIA